MAGRCAEKMLKKLLHLQQRYPVMPDYGAMSLRDELQTRFDIDEMKQLRQKYGVSLQASAQPVPAASPVPQVGYAPVSLQPTAEAENLPQNNVAQSPSNPPSDMDLVNRVYKYIKDNEGFTDYPYYDTTWHQTAGAGINVFNRNRFNRMDWRDMNDLSRKATQEEVDACWNNLLQEKAHLQSESPTPQRNNHRAEHFEQFCDIRVSEEDMRKVYEDHMLKDLPLIRRRIPNFDSLDPRIQNVVMDRMYNMGDGRFSQQKDFLKYASANDFQGLRQEAETSPIAPDRKNWVRRYLK